MYNNLIVTQIMAMSKDKFIGDKNTIPWRCREDMRHFAKNTKGKVCIMGRATYQSIQPPLKDRFVIVVTNNLEVAAEVRTHDLHMVAGSVLEALAMASTMALEGEVMVVGGRQIYQQTMQYTDRLMLSTINVELKQADTAMDWEIPDHVEIIPFEFEVNA